MAGLLETILGYLVRNPPYRRHMYGARTVGRTCRDCHAAGCPDRLILALLIGDGHVKMADGLEASRGWSSGTADDQECGGGASCAASASIPKRASVVPDTEVGPRRGVDVDDSGCEPPYFVPLYGEAGIAMLR